MKVFKLICDLFKIKDWDKPVYIVSETPVIDSLVCGDFIVRDGPDFLALIITGSKRRK